MRDLLMIHETRTMRMLLKKFILSELNDICISEAGSAEEGIALFEQRRFHLVISANEMEKADGGEMFKKSRRTTLNRETPFIVLTSSQKKEVLEHLKNQGIEHTLQTPFTSRELAEKINLACDPRNLRAAGRVSIPEAIAVLRLAGRSMEASIINISDGGLLCDFDYAEEFAPDLFRRVDIDIKLPDGGIQINGLGSQLSHIRVMEYGGNSFTGRIRTGWRFMDISEKKRKILRDIFEEARETFESCQF